MSDIKVLPLESWMPLVEDVRWGMKGNYKVMDFPPMKRDGWYYNRIMDVSWFEVSGIGYWISSQVFKDKMNLLNVPIITEREYRALKIVVDSGIAGNIATKLLESVEFERELHRLYRTGRRGNLRLRKKLLLKKEELIK